jgi:hypothetical protein
VGVETDLGWFACSTVISLVYCPKVEVRAVIWAVRWVIGASRVTSGSTCPSLLTIHHHSLPRPALQITTEHVRTFNRNSDCAQ